MNVFMWVPSIAQLSIQPSSCLRKWLVQEGNLGAALRSINPNLSLQVLSEEMGFALADELPLLKLSKKHSACYIRQIFLRLDDDPVSYGRVVLPKTLYFKRRNAFKNLGTKLIGETLLYSDSRTKRSDFSFCDLDETHVIYQDICKFYPTLLSSPILWSRRSVFYIEGTDPLLITEVFLKSLPK